MQLGSLSLPCSEAKKVMTRMLSLGLVVGLLILLEPVYAVADDTADKSTAIGTVPADAAGRSLNLGFETGTLADWTADGSAFEGSRSRETRLAAAAATCTAGMPAGSGSDLMKKAAMMPQGTLTSVPFRVSKPFASFLVGGGSRAGTYVEIVRKDTGQIIFRASGDDREDLERVAVDLSGHLGQQIVIRLVDGESGGWGHINFDDFRLHDTKPVVPPRRRPARLTSLCMPDSGPRRPRGP